MRAKIEESTITSLKGADRVRKRPGVMFGSDDIDGAIHTVYEIVGNSLDEVRGGHGDKVEIEMTSDGKIRVRDWGRGVPMCWNEKEGRWNWDLIFNELYAGGKYDGKGEVYKYSLGLNGLGAASVQYVSEEFCVESYQGKIKYTMEFRKGKPVGEMRKEEIDEEWGTQISWRLDKEVFTDIDIPAQRIKLYCESQAYLNNTKIVYIDAEGEIDEYVGEGGIRGYMEKEAGERNKGVEGKELQIEGEDSKGEAYTGKCEIYVMRVGEGEEKIENRGYHNTAEMIQGVHITGVRDAFRGFFKKIGDKRRVQIGAGDYERYVRVWITSYSSITSFANQTKTGVKNPFVYDMIYKGVTDILEEGESRGSEVIEGIIEDVIQEAELRKRLKELEQREKEIKKTTKKGERAEKLVDCSSKIRSKRELYIVEGDSALGACKEARDGEIQALLPVRGKTLNCLKANLDSILKSQVIKDIIMTLGCGVEIGDAKFQEEKLKYSKIIICTDADVDGFQIRVLLYTLFYRLFPTLLREGYVYVAETPLYEIEIKGGKSRFAYTEEEREEIEKAVRKEGKKIQRIHRSKGLGENNPDMMWETTMNPATRRLVQLKIDKDEEEVSKLTNMLFGEDKQEQRKEYILEQIKRKEIGDE